MGDQIGVAVSGKMYHVPLKEFNRILNADLDIHLKVSLFSYLCRINTLYMIAKAGSGHIGSSFSSMEIISWIYLNEFKDSDSDSDSIFFSSKGHDAPALYSVLIGLGIIEIDMLGKLRRINGLPGHPDVSTKGIVTNTGSLGMGISKAKGMVFANKIQEIDTNVFILTGDGELQEGQFWESLISASNHNLNELTVVIDHNKLQSDTLVSKVSDLGDLEAKLRSFGWHVERCDGNNVLDLGNTFKSIKKVVDKPKVIIADTVKGKGVSFMEHTSIDSDTEFYKFHSGAPSSDMYIQATQELIDYTNSSLDALSLEPLLLETEMQQSIPKLEKKQSLISAYSLSLLDHAKLNPNIVVLDADLMLDTGIAPFQQEYPQRFLECGIAEQDMVSQAGGMALKGALPVVHSFACFLSTRANEQIYNNSTEHTKIIYVGSLSGILPGGPGHSHQSVRDISALAAIPNLVLVEPSCEQEVEMLFDWCVNSNQGSSYIRLTSVPWPIKFSLPNNYKIKHGQGCILLPGKEICIIAYGPIPVSLAYESAKLANERLGISVKIINLPWLIYIDKAWIHEALNDCKLVISIDNHYREGGQGSRIGEILSENVESKIAFKRIAIDSIPACGTNEEVLEAHNLIEENVINIVKNFLDK
jgi:transketolase